ncbi:MAG: hypothetical protein O2V44_09810 [Candidatus Bathyarchaeota archaeon]|nr:hypothetical protein [Candidatus Bathyarchaeota archaeon]
MAKISWKGNKGLKKHDGSEGTNGGDHEKHVAPRNVYVQWL